MPVKKKKKNFKVKQNLSFKLQQNLTFKKKKLQEQQQQQQDLPFRILEKLTYNTPFYSRGT